MNNLTLFGFKGCGKSYFGRLFSKATGCLWIDSDYLMEAHHNMPCRDIYRKFGEAEFRLLEQKILISLSGVNHCVISVGGGAILNEENRFILERISKLIYLELDKETLKKRVLSSTLPAFLDGKEKEEGFESMYVERLPLYESISSYKISLDASQTDESVIQTMKELMYGL